MVPSSSAQPRDEASPRPGPSRLADALMASTSPAMLTSPRRARRTASSSHLRDQRRGLEAQAVGKPAQRTTATARLRTLQASSPLKTSQQQQRQTPTPTPSCPPSAASSHSPESDHPAVLSFWGPDPVPLPARFARIKQNLIAGHEAELEASWKRLLKALRADVEQIEGLGAHLIPSIEFSDLSDASQTARFGRDMRRYGVGVVRKVVPRADLESSVQDTLRYVDAQRQRGRSASSLSSSSSAGYSAPDATGNIIDNSGVPAPKHDPACFNLFWTPAQVRTRAHPNVCSAQKFMMSLWETRADDMLATNLPISYADRIRVYGAGSNNTHTPGQPGIIPPQKPPESPDDWINALQSAAGIIAQVDNGSLERWEPDGYQRAGTYNRIFQGRWEEYDPWVSRCRASATTDLYNGLWLVYHISHVSRRTGPFHH